MDNFGKGAIVIALLVEVFIVWGALISPTEGLSAPADTRDEMWTHIGLASLLPLSLVGTVVLFWFLQKGET